MSTNLMPLPQVSELAPSDHAADGVDAQQKDDVKGSRAGKGGWKDRARAWNAKAANWWDKTPFGHKGLDSNPFRAREEAAKERKEKSSGAYKDLKDRCGENFKEEWASAAPHLKEELSLFQLIKGPDSSWLSPGTNGVSLNPGMYGQHGYGMRERTTLGNHVCQTLLAPLMLPNVLIGGNNIKHHGKSFTLGSLGVRAARVGQAGLWSVGAGAGAAAFVPGVAASASIPVVSSLAGAFGASGLAGLTIAGTAFPALGLIAGGAMAATGVVNWLISRRQAQDVESIHVKREIQNLQRTMFKARSIGERNELRRLLKNEFDNVADLKKRALKFDPQSPDLGGSGFKAAGPLQAPAASIGNREKADALYNDIMNCSQRLQNLAQDVDLSFNKDAAEVKALESLRSSTAAMADLLNPAANLTGAQAASLKKKVKADFKLAEGHSKKFSHLNEEEMRINLDDTAFDVFLKAGDLQPKINPQAPDRNLSELFSQAGQILSGSRGSRHSEYYREVARIAGFGPPPLSQRQGRDYSGESGGDAGESRGNGNSVAAGSSTPTAP